MTITVANYKPLKSTTCPRCGMRSSDPADIVKCGEKHCLRDAWMAGKIKNYLGQVFAEAKHYPKCLEPDCKEAGCVKGRCQRHFQRKYSREMRAARKAAA
jgi:hypothetical protein